MVEQRFRRFFREVERQLSVSHFALEPCASDPLQDDPLHRGQVGSKKRIVIRTEKRSGSHSLAGDENDFVDVESRFELGERVDVAADETSADVFASRVRCARSFDAL
jgi:hypothetical protein